MKSERTMGEHYYYKQTRELAGLLSWRELGSGVPEPAGDVGGERQTGDAYDRRWAADLPNGLYALITVAYYVGDADTTIESDDSREETLALRRGVEYLICSDLDNPGGSEISSEYDDVEPDEATRLRPTSDNARDLCAQLVLADIDWPVEIERVADLLRYALPTPKTTERQGAATETRVFVGELCVGRIFEVSLSWEKEWSSVFLAEAHDWHEYYTSSRDPALIPVSTVMDEPGDKYDPMIVDTTHDFQQALHTIMSAVPVELHHSVYDPDTTEVPAT